MFGISESNCQLKPWNFAFLEFLGNTWYKSWILPNSNISIFLHIYH